VFCFLNCWVSTANASTPEITKAEAAQILGHMGYENVTVGALIKSVDGVGAGAFSSENMALVVAVGTRNRMSKEIRVTTFMIQIMDGFIMNLFVTNLQGNTKYAFELKTVTIRSNILSPNLSQRKSWKKSRVKTILKNKTF